MVPFPPAGTFEAVQLISASYPTRIPYEDIYGRYKEHMPDFVKALEPQYFTEAIALACDVDSADYQLGNTKIFLKKAGRNQKKAILQHSPFMPYGDCLFSITDAGIVDAVDA